MGVEKKKIFCIFSNLLGLRTISAGFQNALNQFNDTEADYFFIDESDYQKYPAPLWARVSCTLELVFVARNKFKREGRNKNFDVLLINRFELALAFPGLVKKIPTVLISDTTPKLAQLLIRQAFSNFWVRLRSFLFEKIVSLWCFSVFRAARHFFPASDWCADSFIRDYHIDKENIAVLYPPVDLEKWSVSKSNPSDTFRILFIGNDFKRKGGYFLLDMYKKYFQNKADLWIVSNDPNLSNQRFLPGVRLFAGITHARLDELIAIYKEADIFVFPTYLDQLGIVIQEAMAAGLSVIARDVGGIFNLVQDDLNGYLMPYGSREEEWVQKIQYLIDHPDERARMGANSRKLAEDKFDQRKFNDTIRLTIEKVLAECES